MQTIDPRMFQAEGAAAPAPAAPAPAAPAAPAGQLAPQPAAQPAAQPAPADTRSWWEQMQGLSAEERNWIAAKGYNTPDPMTALERAVKGQRLAEQRLGAPADQLLTKPKDGQKLADWMRANNAVFGLPDALEKYEVKRPEGLPPNVPWDDTLASAARQVAFEEGLPPAALDRMVKVYADRIGALFADADGKRSAAEAEMMQQLEKDWGGQTPARVAAAQRAAQAVMAKAGLKAEDMASVALALQPKVGDAGIMRMFAAIGDLMGEDSFVPGGGLGGGMAMTPEAAQAEVNQIEAPGGPYDQARQRGDRQEMERLLERRRVLFRIMTGGR